MSRASAVCSALLLLLSLSPLRAEDAVKPGSAVATFAAGCYWCTESDFDKLKGVLDTTSGFMGGRTENPTYDEVSSGKTGHTEVVRVSYDPAVVTYQQLLDHYWVNVDAVDGTGQFCDRGSQYRPAIFVYNDEQKTLADASKKKLESSGQFKEPIAVQIMPASAFTPAPDQNFYQTNSIRYKFYRSGCGRDARLKQLWGDKAGH
jgi:methionine-S-sulfoxide reductase